MEPNTSSPNQGSTFFYAWQSDSPSRDNRSFIESALDQAFKNLAKTGKIDSSPRLDKDTKDVPGLPDIANTIFEKIRNADAFVADVSFVAEITAKQARTKRLPNPNVMIELGYALSMLGGERVILVMNTFTGSGDDLPFDLRNRRWPIPYQLAPNADEATRAEQKRLLSADVALENPQAISRLLRPAFDYIWREHGYPRSLNYSESGDWIGR